MATALLGFMSVVYARPSEYDHTKFDCDHRLVEETRYAIFGIDSAKLRVPRLPDETLAAFKERLDQNVKAIHVAYQIGHMAAKEQIREVLGL